MDITLFQTLADPTRLRILEALRGGECAVGDLVKRVDIQQSGVSRHLRILHEAGLVEARADGQRRLYSLREEPFRELDAWLAGYRQIWEARLDRFGAALERQQAARTPTTDDPT
jgi:DNA-binding transcriptional ArsR family regulator